MSMPPILHDFHIKNTSKAIIEITLEKSHINAAIVTRPFYGKSITYIIKELTLIWFHFSVSSLMNMKITFLQMIILGRDWKY